MALNGHHWRVSLNIFQVSDPLLQKLRGILETVDINTLSPVEALLKLQQLKNEMNN